MQIKYIWEEDDIATGKIVKDNAGERFLICRGLHSDQELWYVVNLSSCFVSEGYMKDSFLNMLNTFNFVLEPKSD